jgi:hypothetical protein
MENFNNLFTKKNIPQFILFILMIIYLIMGYKLPETVANVIDTTYGKIIVVLCALVLFAFANPILGVIGFLVAYTLITQSTVQTGTLAMDRYLPSEKEKQCNLSAWNQFPYTLEQEVVKKMAPINKTGSGAPVSWQPLLDDNRDAAPVGYNGVN